MTKMDNNTIIEKQIVSYFNKVIVNAANNYYRKKEKKMSEIELTDNIEKYNISIVDYGFSEIEMEKVNIIGIPIYLSNERLIAVLKLLKEKERQFLIYYYVLEFSVNDIADLLEMKVFGVYSLKRRVLIKLREHFDLN